MIPNADPPKAGPTAAEMEAAEKARKRQEEETARKAEVYIFSQHNAYTWMQVIILPYCLESFREGKAHSVFLSC